jgi:hypothetical protein
MASPGKRARQEIDRLLTAAGWAVQDFKGANLHAARDVALREFELNPGRVLLTRGRDGTVVFVSPDPRMDATIERLRQVGFRDLSAAP